VIDSPRSARIPPPGALAGRPCLRLPPLRARDDGWLDEAV